MIQMEYQYTSFCLFCCLVLSMVSGIGQPSEMLFVDGPVMAESRALIQAGDARTRAVFSSLQAEADLALSAAPASVMDKEITPPSGDKHDYISQGPYWWPDSNQVDGLPYIRRDGVVNPEREKFTDRKNLSDLIKSVSVLAKVYYFTGKEAYAQKAIELLRAWFMDEATRMNPNLNFGQGIPGRTKGRGIGIIETSGLGSVTDAIYLLRASTHWQNTDEAGMQQWMGAYLDWLRTSKNGKEEAVHPNNHGTWYAVQATALAIFTGHSDWAKEWISAAKTSLLDPHIESTGEQTLETARTRGWDYSVMNLKGLFYLARIGEHLEVDLWSYRNINGATLQDALDYLIPLTLDKAPLPFQQIKPVEPSKLIPHLRMARTAYQKKAYLRTARKISKQYAKQSDISSLFF